MPYDFPTLASTGTIVTVPDGSYRVWDSQKWHAAPSGSVIYTAGGYLPLTGGTVSGPTTFLSTVNVGPSGGNQAQLVGAAGTGAATLWTTGGNLNIAAQGAGWIINIPAQPLQIGSRLQTNNQLITLAGSTPMAPVANLAATIGGSSTISGYTANNLVTIGSNNDALNSGSGALNYMFVTGQLTSGWNGNRDGIYVQLQASAATTVPDGNNGYLVAIGSLSIADANFGSPATGFGVSNHGLGNMFGGVLGTRLTGNATRHHSCVGLELDTDNHTGSSVATEVGLADRAHLHPRCTG